MSHQTIFGDLRQRAIAVYRVKTVSSEYLVGIHEQRGRKFVIVRGAEGTDREHVVVRDSDPRVGERSLFDLPIAEWPGRVLEVATMTTSRVESVVVETDPLAIAAVAVDGKLDRNPWSRPAAEPRSSGGIALPPPHGMSESPAIVPMNARGTTPAAEPIAREEAQRLARQVVVGGPVVAPAGKPPPAGQPEQPPPAQVPYPLRHVTYAESVVQLLRSIARRDKLFADLDGNREYRDRLRLALDESVTLLEQIRRRDRHK